MASAFLSVSNTKTAGFVLTGGMSTRMGRDKALLEWQQQPIAESIARCVCEVAGNVTLVGAPERYRSLPFSAISDRYSDCGPIAGIEAALASDRAARFNLIVACDLPDLVIQPQLMARLLEQAIVSDTLCLAAQEPAGQLHPLFAVYRREALAGIREFLRGGRRRLMDLFEALGGKAWPLSGTLANVNAPKDWFEWQKK